MHSEILKVFGLIVKQRLRNCCIVQTQINHNLDILWSILIKQLEKKCVMVYFISIGSDSVRGLGVFSQEANMLLRSYAFTSCVVAAVMQNWHIHDSLFYFIDCIWQRPKLIMMTSWYEVFLSSLIPIPLFLIPTAFLCSFLAALLQLLLTLLLEIANLIENLWQFLSLAVALGLARQFQVLAGCAIKTSPMKFRLRCYNAGGRRKPTRQWVKRFMLRWKRSHAWTWLWSSRSGCCTGQLRINVMMKSVFQSLVCTIGNTILLSTVHVGLGNWDRPIALPWVVIVPLTQLQSLGCSCCSPPTLQSFGWS